MLYAVHYTNRFEDRVQELAFQRELVRRLLACALDEEFGLKLSALAQERTPQGRPYFVGCPVHFSVSHCRGLVCCGVSRFPLGVDGEAPRFVSQGLKQRACTPQEVLWLSSQPDPDAAFLALWTLKESVMKLSGQGIAYGFQNASFWVENGSFRFRDPAIRLSHFAVEGGWHISAASREEDFSQLHWRKPELIFV